MRPQQGSKQAMEQRHQPPTVFMVDEDAAVRRKTEEMVVEDGWHFRGFNDGESFLQVYRSESGGCLLVDIPSPGVASLEFHTKLQQLPYSPPVIVVSAAANVALVVEAMKQGAVDFFEKPIPRQSLLRSLAAAVRVGEEQRRKFQQQREVDRRLATLSSRESDVLHLLVEGLLNKQIAARLDISVRTVELKRARILRSMQVASVGELTCLLVRSHRLRFHDASLQLVPARLYGQSLTGKSSQIVPQIPTTTPVPVPCLKSPDPYADIHSSTLS